MAPGVELFIADPISMLDTQQTVAWMTSNGVRIINASWSSDYLFEGPGDGTSPYPDSTYALVDQAVAGGALWANGAGHPFEILEYTAAVTGTFAIRIVRAAGAPTTRMQLLVYGLRDTVSYQVPAGTLPAPADSAHPGMG